MKVSQRIIHTSCPSALMRRDWSRVPFRAAPKGEATKRAMKAMAMTVITRLK